MITLTVTRDKFEPEFTLGTISTDKMKIAETCEDTDRFLEKDIEHVNQHKLYGKTAIPRGRYKVTLSFSHRFQKILPEVHDVPGYEGVRIHGGNGPEDTLGCILVGQFRTAKGIYNCAPAVARVIAILEEAENTGEDVYLEVR